MWRGLSPSLSLLLLLGFTLRGLDALEETSTSAWRAKTQPMTEATVAAKAHREAASTSSSSTSTSSSSSSSTSTSSSSSTFTSSSSSSSSSTSSSSSPAKAPDSLREAEPLSPGRDAPAVGAGGRVEPPTAEPLEEDELDNQENVISQLLGDYDKVKTVSSGSDCVCRCTVRPIKRSDCGDGTSPPQSAYTVETVTKGTDCKKCTCMAPSSAVNPCEGEYRFKKLQEASKDDIKLATIIDLLEGSLYGLDLLKLQSVTTKLLSRMDNMEKAFTRNLTERAREKERAKDRAKEKEREKKAQQKKKKANDMANGGQKVRAPVHANKQKNHESQPKKNQEQQGLEQQQQQQQQQSANNRTGSPKPVKEKNSMVVKGVTFYKAEEIYKENDRGRAKNTSSWDLLISDQLPPLRTLPVQRPAPAPSVRTELDAKDSSRRESDPAPTQQPTTSRPATAKPTATTTAPALTTTIPPTTTTAAAPEPTTTTTVSTTTSQQTTTQRTTPPVTHHSVAASRTRPAVDASPTAAPQAGPKSRLSWTESPADRPKTTKKPGLCKDTVASISDPVQHNSYGLSDGAWMRDARGHGNVIYLTSGHYGNSLLEFREVEAFKSGQPSNSYKLPYSFTGTGHVVFNGAFYYNRAFSRDVIRYDLRHRYVAAWTTLHDALLEEQGHRTQTEVELAVDESGLWVLYPALDTEGFHQEVILLVHLHPRELQPIRTFRTGLRRGRYGNSFLVCGVLYAVDSMERRYANVTYAFDTHTLTHTVPSLAFMNVHGHTSQLAYCPLDKKLYAWDNGRQMTYDVVFAY